MKTIAVYPWDMLGKLSAVKWYEYYINKFFVLDHIDDFGIWMIELG